MSLIQLWEALDKLIIMEVTINYGMHAIKLQHSFIIIRTRKTHRNYLL